MTIIVTGDRKWYPEYFIERVVKGLIAKHGRDIVIRHGACEGIDLTFETACQAAGVMADPMFANWYEHGNKAGPIRNSHMVLKGADLCLAFHRHLATSKGTLDCACRAMSANIPTWLISSDNPGVRPRRLSLDEPMFEEWVRRNG